MLKGEAFVALTYPSLFRRCPLRLVRCRCSSLTNVLKSFVFLTAVPLLVASSPLVSPLSYLCGRVVRSISVLIGMALSLVKSLVKVWLQWLTRCLLPIRTTWLRVRNLLID